MIVSVKLVVESVIGLEWLIQLEVLNGGGRGGFVGSISKEVVNSD